MPTAWLLLFTVCNMQGCYEVLDTPWNSNSFSTKETCMKAGAQRIAGPSIMYFRYRCVRVVEG